jgi:hypothetical protein
VSTRLKWSASLAGIAAAVLCAILIRDLSTDTPGKIVETSSGTVVIAAETSEGSEAGLENTLALTSDGCVGILGGQDGPVSEKAIVLPAGTKVIDESPLTLRVNGEEYRLGDIIKGSGGDVDPGDRGSPVPKSSLTCLNRTVFVMNDSD